MSNLWTAKITLKSGKSWLFSYGIGCTRAEAKANYKHSGRAYTDERHGSKVTFVKIEIKEKQSSVSDHRR